MPASPDRPSATDPALRIRRVLPAEHEAVGELCVRAYRAGGHLGADDHYAQVLRDVAARDSAGPVLVALAGGELVGTVTTCPPGTAFAEISQAGEFEFRFLAVDPVAWGRGIAPELVAACEDIAREQGDHAIVLCVIEQNAAGHRLYQRLGFARLPERDWSPAPGVSLQAYIRPVAGRPADS